ncbi:dihydroxyacetone kinase transcriptional activator DhaS [Vagococcus acidifermentans]|uniref:Dihydroxyacetone kinase transcriptional activator DhaS n=1 Tax=Vagococcus acidifermentans TaxID=564710 RepID=A0A430ATX5_9ENTE|nr:dihydroxyacetone kinase transcriptional activator DhaS [Vagococcus acidifermentans]RSU11501.1 dihydroxyacetone kinase transcriptional activator DhaS [Vagococcus acidifermentans]
MMPNGSLITKKVIAYSFKNLLKQTDFQKISVKEIMTAADYRRQTFYDYFTDKYDLLTWIYHQELTETVTDFIGYEHWTAIIHRLLVHFQKNQPYYQKVLYLPPPVAFDDLVLPHCQELVAVIVADTAGRPYTDPLVKEQQIKFLAYALKGTIKDWLASNCKEDLTQIESALSQNLNHFCGKAV